LAVAGCFFHVFRHQGFELRLGALMVDERRAGCAEEVGEICPRIRPAHIDNANRFDPRPRWLDAIGPRRLASFDTAPKSMLGGDKKMLVERVGGYGHLDPFAAAGDNGKRRRPGVGHPHVVLQLGHMLLRRRFLGERPGQHELGLEHGVVGVDEPVQRPLKPVPAFDANILLPGALRPWIEDEAERMPCPPDFIASAAITALGSIVGARCAIKPKAHDPWLVVPNLWGGIVGDPSAKKSPAWSTALKPLDRLIAKAQDPQSVAMRRYENERVVFSARSDALEARLKETAKKPSKGDPFSIARELQELRDQAPTAPTLRRYKTNDTTVEKLGELLRKTPEDCWFCGTNWSG
jgi:hypothetical protein